MTDLSGKGAFITGGTSGIGLAVALQLVARGCPLFTCGRDSAKLKAALESLSAGGAASGGVTADLGTCEGVTSAFAGADAFLPNLEICVVNAALPAGGDLLARGIDYWKRIVDVNLAATISVCVEACSRMVKTGGGHIVIIGSMSAGTTEAGSSVYSATKAGVRGFAQALRKEMNPRGIRVTLIEPGCTSSEMVTESPEDRQRMIDSHLMLDPADVATAVLFALEQPLRSDVIEIKVRPHLQLI